MRLLAFLVFDFVLVIRITVSGYFVAIRLNCGVDTGESARPWDFGWIHLYFENYQVILFSSSFPSVFIESSIYFRFRFSSLVNLHAYAFHFNQSCLSSVFFSI